jgi:general secretion pathway protein H
MRTLHDRSRGFTLIEILVVVVIMAVVISLAVLAIGVTGRDRQLDEESQRIEGLLNMLHDRALIEGRDFGMRLEPAAYEFLTYDTRLSRWKRLDQESEFRRRVLPRGLNFQLELDGQQVVLKPDDPNVTQDPTTPLSAPQVAVAASGESTPFRVLLQRQETNAVATVRGDSLGKLTRQSTDHPEKPS